MMNVCLCALEDPTFNSMYIENVYLYKISLFSCQTLSSDFSWCPKIEILKHVPEGAETEEGLQRELQVLRYLLSSCDDIFSFLLSFNISRFTISRAVGYFNLAI